MNNANLQRYGGHEMEVAAALAAQAGAPPRYAAMRPGGQPQDPSAAGQSALDSVQALAQGRADYFHYLQPRHPQHPHQQMQQEHKDMQDHHHSEQQQGVGQPPSTFMGLPDRPPINVAPDTGPLRIPPPGMTMPSMSKMQLSDIPTSFIHPHDVLCGRGGGTNNHNGNEKFRELVTQQKVLYLHSSKRDKPFVSRGIVRAVRAQNPPGRFLQKDEKTGFWYDIGDQKAREKTSQALREGAPEIRREITSTMAPASALRPQIIPPAGLPPSPLAPAIPMSSQLRQMQLQRQDDANLANMRAAAAMGYPGAHQAHMAAMVAVGRGAPGQANTGAMGQQPPHPMMGYGRGQMVPQQAHSQLQSQQQQAHSQQMSQQQSHAQGTPPLMTSQQAHAVAAAAASRIYHPSAGPQRSQPNPLINFSTGTSTPLTLPPNQASKNQRKLSVAMRTKKQTNITARTILESSTKRKPVQPPKTKRDGPLVKPLGQDISRRLVLAEAVAQKTVNGMITDELKEEEYRTSLYLDAGLIGIKPDEISKLTMEGKTEFQIVEKCYSQLKNSIAPAGDDVLEQRKRKATQSIIQKAKVPKFPELGPNEEPLNTTACTLKQQAIAEALLAIGA